MDPLTIGLAIAGTKKLLESANDLKDIAGGLDKLFHASEAKPKKVDHKKPKTRTQQLLRMKAGDADYDDETSISSVANDILEQKRNEMALHNLGVEIDNKFGKGTFEAIKEERAKRIEAKKIQDKKNKEKAAAQKEIDDKYWDNVFAIIKNIAILIGVSIICVIVGWLMVNFGCKEAVC
jgi:hypothetical protein|tara:strand:- start:492 stop:1028 length:537 start_codon:yes stop_codon:yes gene_type:complete